MIGHVHLINFFLAFHYFFGENMRTQIQNTNNVPLSLSWSVLIFLSFLCLPCTFYNQTVESKKGCTQDNSKHINRTEEVSTDKATNTRTDWASAEQLDLIEAVPYHEHFIHTSEEAMPHG